MLIPGAPHLLKRHNSYIGEIKNTANSNILPRHAHFPIFQGAEMRLRLRPSRPRLWKIMFWDTTALVHKHVRY